MTSATRIPLHVRKPGRQSSTAAIARAFLTGTTRCFGAAAVILLTAGGALIGAWWILALSLQAGSDLRSSLTIAPPGTRVAWSGADDRSAQLRAVTVAALLPANDPVDETEIPHLDEATVAVLEPAPAPETAAEAVSAPVQSAAQKQKVASLDNDVTGSIGTAQLAYAPTPAIISTSPTVQDDIPALPLPRSRPRLASLGAPDSLGIVPEEDASLLKTAFYDIKAQAVYLPNGERLEAHSGLGSLMDDPRHVRQKNRGPTPPNTYRLTLRESLFHGVRAIRLTPESDSRMYGRDGILAHTYMLGPSGQSNGCVSFKDYPRFLRAFLKGEIDRMVVVPYLAEPPRFFARSRKPRHDQASLTVPAT
jgi:hypothetical protein